MSRPTLLAIFLMSLAGPAAAETLLVERVAQETGALPSRGASMADVQARFGQPASRMQPAGGQKRQWPTIHRWVYPGFTVYFERGRVIDAVANKAAVTEIGPKPPIR